MNDPPNFSEEAFDNLFENRPLPSASEELRHVLLRKTTRVLRRRRRLRQGGSVAVLILCYLAGIATVKCWPQPSPKPDDPVIAQHEVDPVKPPEPPAPPPGIARASAIDPNLPAPALEQLGESAGKDQRAAHFFLAGDRYEKAGDMSAALRCYKLALDAGTEADLALSVSDGYLLMVLKNARKKEKLHGKPGA